MIEDNKTMFEKANIVNWHKAGLLGKGATVVVLDNQGLPHKRTKVVLPFTNHWDIDHKTNVCSVIREVAPECKIVGLNFTYDKDRSIKWILDHEAEIDAINCSWESDFSGQNKIVFETLQYLDIPIFCASGNHKGKNYVAYPANLPWTIGVGAFSDYHNDKASYSQYGPELDCLAFTNINIRNKTGRVFQFFGTSASAPFAVGMFALYTGWRKQRGLSRLGRAEAKEFIRINCKEVLGPGPNLQSGYGLFTLPQVPAGAAILASPIESLEEVQPLEIILEIGQKEAMIDGASVPLDAAPILHKGCTMVPLRFITEQIGKAVGKKVNFYWDSKKKTVTLLVE
jgi:hypothetical protein